MGEKIDSWRDLEKFGFIWLTGEACGIGFRSRIDLTDTGREILQGFFGFQDTEGFAENWNHRDGATKSVMLPNSMMSDLAVYCLLIRSRWEVVLKVNFNGKGYSSYFIQGMTQEEWEQMADRAEMMWPNSYRLYTNHATSGIGGLNVHHFTGRVL